MSAPHTHAGPRPAPLLNRFPGNVRKDLLEALLADLWASLEHHLADPVRIGLDERKRTVTFMGAARFCIDVHTGRVGVRGLRVRNAMAVFAGENDPVVIDLPAKVEGFWMEAFLAPWRDRIAACLIDHCATGSDLSWWAALKRELGHALKRNTNWFRLRCRLRDALQLDPDVMRWCRKGRPRSLNYVTQVQYNAALAQASTYRRIEADNPNLVWLYNVLRAGNFHPGGRDPVPAMKACLLEGGANGEAGWRLVANGKEQDFRHIIDFVDQNGWHWGRHEYLPKWLRLLGKLRRSHAVPRPLTGLFEHDAYDGMRTGKGDRVRFRGVLLQPGVLRAILDEGERRLAKGTHKRFIEADLIEVLTWLEAEKPLFDKHQLRMGWGHLVGSTLAWRTECEAYKALALLEWESLLPETRFGPWRVLPLTVAWQLRREALTRRHCADQYLEECMNGLDRLFSVRNEAGKSLATIGIERAGAGWRVFGFRGFANQPVPDALLGLDKDVLRRYTDLWRLTKEGAKAMEDEAAEA